MNGPSQYATLFDMRFDSDTFYETPPLHGSATRSAITDSETFSAARSR